MKQKNCELIFFNKLFFGEEGTRDNFILSERKAARQVEGGAGWKSEKQYEAEMSFSCLVFSAFCVKKVLSYVKRRDKILFETFAAYKALQNEWIKVLRNF